MHLDPATRIAKLEAENASLRAEFARLRDMVDEIVDALDMALAADRLSRVGLERVPAEGRA